MNLRSAGSERKAGKETEKDKPRQNQKTRPISLFKYTHNDVFEDLNLYVVLMNGSSHTRLGEESELFFFIVFTPPVKLC